MNEPLFWNTLDEAAEWLNKKTGERWTKNRIIDFSIKEIEGDHYFLLNKRPIKHNDERLPYDAYIKVSVPRNAGVGVYKYKNDTGIKWGSPYQAPLGNELTKCRYQSYRHTAFLYRNNLYDLLLHGETEIRSVAIKISDHGEWHFDLFEPITEPPYPLIYESRDCKGVLYPNSVYDIGCPFHVDMGMLGIDGENLKYLLSVFKEVQEATQGEVNKLVASAVHGTQTSNHQPNSSGENETMVAFVMHQKETKDWKKDVFSEPILKAIEEVECLDDLLVFDKLKEYQKKGLYGLIIKKDSSGNRIDSQYYANSRKNLELGNFKKRMGRLRIKHEKWCQ